MPFIDEENEDLAFDQQRLSALPEFEAQSPDLMDITMATFRTENTVGAFIAREDGLPDSVVTNTDFNPWDAMTDDEKLDKRFIDNALLADSVEELEAVRRQTRRERKDRQTIADGGALSFAVSFGVSGVADPINLIPVGGTAYKTYRNGKSILAAGLATGSVAAGSTAAQESLLHFNQIERTYGESAVNMSGAFLLGSVLGVGVNGLSRFGDPKQLGEEIENVMNVEPKVAQGQDSVGAAAVNLDVKAAGFPVVEKTLRVFGTEADKAKQISEMVANKTIRFLGFDPLSYSVTSQNPFTRQIATDLADNPILMDGAPKQSVESITKPKYDAMYLRALEVHDEALKSHRKNFGAMKKKEFNEAVSSAIRNAAFDDTGANRYIAQAAKAWDEQLYKPIRDELIANGQLPEGVNVSTAANYLNRQWSPEKITDNFDDFVTTVAGWLRSRDQELIGKAQEARREFVDLSEAKRLADKGEADKAKLQPRLDKLNKQREELRNQKQKLVARVFERREVLDKQIAKLKAERAKIDAEIKDTPRGQVGAKRRIQKKIDSRIKEIEKRFDRADAERNLTRRLNALEDQISGIKDKMRQADDAIKGFDPETLPRLKELEELTGKAEFKESLDLEEQDYDDIASQIAGRIQGMPDGKMPYDWQLGEGSGNKGEKNSGGVNGTNIKGPLKKRVFDIPDNMVEKFLENDVELLAKKYQRQLGFDIEMHRKFDGDLELKFPLQSMRRWWDDKIRDAKTPREAKKMAKEKSRDIKNLEGMRDRLRGQFGNDDPNSGWSRAGRAFRDWNYMRMLGGVVASSFPDVARVMMAEGFVNSFKNGLVPMIAKHKKFKVAAKEGRAYGVGAEVLTGGRSEILADIDDYARGKTVIERGLQLGAEKFSQINLMDRWTQAVKQLHLVTMQTSIINGFKKGQIDKRLKRLGIDDNDARMMMDQINKFGREIDGLQTSGARNWDDTRLAELWGAAMRSESDRVIIIPGQEKPLFMSTELGKSILQFRSFMLSATQRVLISGMQGADHNFMGGVVMLTSLGMMTYAFKQWDAGRPISDDPMVWVSEGIDRSGVLGVLMEMNNTVEKVSRNSLGMRPLLGIATPGSRYASRSAIEAFAGPTFGSLLSTVINVAGAGSASITGGDDLKESDIRTIRRLIPLQNLTFLRQGFDKLEEVIQ